jgi:pimeloyl-ACP methyl ester carboxylesterase
MIDKGSGPTVLMIPGLQGRWEWMSPAVDALATHCRVISISLAGDRGSLRELDPAKRFHNYLDWVDELVNRCGVKQVALCAVSYGGLVALHYAAHRPVRISSLVLISSPSPQWQPNRQFKWRLQAPRLLSPAFLLSSPFRLYPEITRAVLSFVHRVWFAITYLRRVIKSPCSSTNMPKRVQLIEDIDFVEDCKHIDAPTLVVTGSPGPDRVVSVDSRREHLKAVPGASYEQINDTGHIGPVTKPDVFAKVVSNFVMNHSHDDQLLLRALA